MYYVTGEVASVSHKGNLADGNERVTVNLLDMGQDVWVSTDDAEYMESLLKVGRGDDVTIPCAVRAGSGANAGRLFINMRGPAHVEATAAQKRAARGAPAAPQAKAS